MLYSFKGVARGGLAVGNSSKGKASSLVDPGRSGANNFGLGDDLYHELKQIARQRIRGMRPGATLNCTALVHEAFLKISQSDATNELDRDHLLALSSLAMRQIIVDAARRKQAEKRGAGAIHVTLQESAVSESESDIDLLELDEALTRLGARDPDLEKLVFLKFFAGLTTEQVARIRNTSVRTTERDWTRARVYLYRYLRPDE